MVEQRISSRYARAILGIAKEENSTELVLNEFRIVLKAIKDSRDLNTLFKSPIVQFWKKKKIIIEIFQPLVSKLTLNFLLLLADKHRESIYSSIAYQYEVQYNLMNNRLPLKISSAIELSDDIKQKVLAKLTEITQKTILPEFIVNKNIIGGIIIKIDDWVFDASIKNQLNLLFKSLSEGVII